jgi:hypothetical protein
MIDKIQKWKAVETNVAQLQTQIIDVVRLADEEGWTETKRQQLKQLGDSMRTQIETLRKELKEFQP